MTDDTPERPASAGKKRLYATGLRVIVWALLITLGGRLAIPIPVVPITLQTFFVILAGLIDGPRIGAAAAGLYVVAGLLGAPVFAGGVGGLAFFSRPSVGYALAFPLGGAIAGLASARRLGEYTLLKGLAAAVAAHLVILLFGFAGMTVNGIEAEKAMAASVVLLPGALVKSALTAFVALLWGSPGPRGGGTM